MHNMRILMKNMRRLSISKRYSIYPNVLKIVSSLVVDIRMFCKNLKR